MPAAFLSADHPESSAPAPIRRDRGAMPAGAAAGTGLGLPETGACTEAGSENACPLYVICEIHKNRHPFISILCESYKMQ